MIRRNEDVRKCENIGGQETKTKVRNRVSKLEMARSHTTSHEDWTWYTIGKETNVCKESVVHDKQVNVDHGLDGLLHKGGCADAGS